MDRGENPEMNGRDDTPSGIIAWVVIMALLVLIPVGWAVAGELIGP